MVSPADRVRQIESGSSGPACRVRAVKSGRSGPADRVREIESTESPWDGIAYPGTGVFPRDGRGNLFAIEGILKI